MNGPSVVRSSRRPCSSGYHSLGQQSEFLRSFPWQATTFTLVFVNCLLLVSNASYRLRQFRVVSEPLPHFLSLRLRIFVELRFDAREADSLANDRYFERLAVLAVVD